MPQVGVSIPGVAVSLSCGVSLGTATPYFNFGGESLQGIAVSLGTTSSGPPPSGGTGTLIFTNATSAVNIVLFGGFG